MKNALCCLVLLLAASRLYAAPVAVPISVQGVGIDPTFGLPMPALTPPQRKMPVAHWMWDGLVAGTQEVEFRTTFTLRAQPRRAETWITGDDAFALFINGQKVDASQAVEQGWKQAHQDTVGPLLHAGKNVLAIIGTNSGGAAGMLCELDADGVPLIVSGPLWKALLSASPPAGWQDAAFDDTGWQQATDEGPVGTGPWADGVVGWPQSGGAWYMAHQAHQPVAIEPLVGASGQRQELVDFGRELSGRLEIAGPDGTAVVVHTGETRAAALRVLTDPRLAAIDNSGPWTLTLRGSAPQDTPYTAFRYALLTFPGGMVPLSRLVCDFKYYPVTYKGAFDCSDPLLTRIWYAGAYTAHLCMQEDIWDAPKRDRGLWIGDLDVSGETINDVFADRFLMEKTIAEGRAQAQAGRMATRMPAQDINSIPGYTAAWFGVLADFYRHTGDLHFLQSQRAAILSLLAFQQTEFDAQDLFANPQKEWDFCDWAPGLVQGTPQTRATTDLFDIYGVGQAVFLLRALGDAADAARYAAWQARLTDAARRHLWNPVTQTYGATLQENTMAVLSGAATLAQREAIWRNILAPGSPAWAVPSAPDLAGSEPLSPYYGAYVLRADALLGQTQAGLAFIRRTWGAMLGRGTTTTWECFDPSFPLDMNAILPKMPYLSLCHGWSTGPTAFLTESVLGIRPACGGFSDVIIHPMLGDLRWASGTIPTPRGPLRLRVQKASSGLACTLTMPPGVSAQVTLGSRSWTLAHAGTYRLRSI